MKIIDLLNKIANGEEVPEKIIYKETLYSYHKDIDYENQSGNYLFGDRVCICSEDLNNEVEIPEEYKEDQEHKISGKLTQFEEDARRFYLALSSIKAYLEYCIINHINVDEYYLIDYIMKKLYNVKEGK